MDVSTGDDDAGNRIFGRVIGASADVILAEESRRNFTFPPQSKPLTDKQILADETLRYYFGLNGGAGPVSKQGRKIVNAIEAAHGIKGAA